MSTSYLTKVSRAFCTQSSRQLFAKVVSEQPPNSYRQLPLGLRYFNPPPIKNIGQVIKCDPCLCRRLETSTKAKNQE